MNARLRTGVVGLGFFGSRHARIYHQHPAAELVSVCDVNAQAAHDLASATGATAFADLETMLVESDLDAVSVCLPDRLHESAAIAVSRAGKAMLLEKPFAHETSAARRILDAVETSGSRLMVGHILRFDPRYVQVFAASAPEKLGQLIHVRAERTGIRATASRLRSASSILFYMGVHDVDAMQWTARSRIARVYAQKRQILGNQNEDSLFAVVSFENGAIGSLDLSWAWPDGLMNGYKATLELVGTSAATSLDCTDQGFQQVDDVKIIGGDTHLWPEINGRIVGDLADEIGHFITATLAGTPYVQHHMEAFDAIPVLDALAESAVSGAPVTVRR